MVRGLRCLAWPLFLSLLTSSALAGAWTQPRGGGYYQLAYLTTRADGRLDCRGDAAAADVFGGEYVDRLLHAYVEHGWREGWTLVGSVAWRDQSIVDSAVPDYGTRSTGDLRLGSRWALRRGSVPVSVEALLSVPTYPRTDFAAPVGEREQYLPAGSGVVEAEFRLQAGLSLYPRPAWAGLEFGRRQRGGVFGDQWLLAAEVGARSSVWMIQAGLRATFPDGDPCAARSVGSVTYHERSVVFLPRFSGRLREGVWAHASVGMLLQGRNVLDGAQWGLAVSFLREGR